MAKRKTNKSVKKRVKVTANGKIKRHKAGSGHLLSKKSAKRRRHLRQSTTIHPADKKKIERLI